MGKISSVVLPSGDSYDIKAAAIPYGKLDSSSTATVLTATVPGITSLYSGVCVWLTNGVITSASGCTLNINNLGAKPIYSSQAAATAVTTLFNINYTALLIYNEERVTGGCWDYVYGYDSNTNTIGYQIRTHAVSMPMDSITYRYRLLFQSADGKKFVPANKSTSTNATSSRSVNQTPIDPFGLIIYYGTTASVAAGSKPNSSYLWQQYNGIALGYSFNNTNAALTLTVSRPIYLKCAQLANGSAIIDGGTPFVQDLPSTEDGYIYILLGIAESATTFMLTLEHPVYYYDGTGIRIWTGKAIPKKTSDLANDSGFIALGGSTVASDGQIPIYRASNSGWVLSDLTSELGASNAAIYYIEYDNVNSLFKIDCNITSILRETMSERNVLFVWNDSGHIYMFSVKEILFDSPATIYHVILQGVRSGGMEEVTFNFQPASSNPADGLISTDPALWSKDDILTRMDSKNIAAVVDSNGSSIITTTNGDFIGFTELITAYVSVKNLEIGYIDPNVGIYEAHIGRITYYDYSTMRIDILFYFPYSQKLVTFVQTTIDGVDALVSNSVYESAHLPEVSTNDNGKVLRVVNGEWAAASLPSASGVSF